MRYFSSQSGTLLLSSSSNLTTTTTNSSSKNNDDDQMFACIRKAEEASAVLAVRTDEHMLNYTLDQLCQALSATQYIKQTSSYSTLSLSLNSTRPFLEQSLAQLDQSISVLLRLVDSSIDRLERSVRALEHYAELNNSVASDLEEIEGCLEAARFRRQVSEYEYSICKCLRPRNKKQQHK
jgi:hypothetical protein